VLVGPATVAWHSVDRLLSRCGMSRPWIVGPMTLFALIVAGVVVVGVVAVIGIAALRRHREDPWRNAELFLPNDDAVPRGGQITARYRCRPRTPGGADGARVSAELRCEEVVGGEPVEPPLAQVPIEVVDHSSTDLVETDLIVRVPAHGVPPTVHTRAASIRWEIVVRVASADGSRVEVKRALDVASRVAV
jgi:hypothetical protein